MREHRSRGDRCVLATACPTAQAARACEVWGLELAAHTVFDVDEGVFTGRVSRYAFGPHKLAQLRRWFDDNGERLDEATFYTDSIADLPTLERVGHPVAVHPDRQLADTARRRGWPVVAWSP